MADPTLGGAFPDLPATWPAWVKTMVGFAIAIFGALTGRIAWHSMQVGAGERKPFGRELLLELPMAIGLGFVAGGLIDFYRLSTPMAVMVATIVGWLGPKGLTVLVVRLWEWKFGKGKGDSK